MELKIKYINLLRFEWSSVSEGSQLCPSWCPCVPSSRHRRTLWLYPGQVGEELDVWGDCVHLCKWHGSTGALQKKTHSIAGNANSSRVPSVPQALQTWSISSEQAEKPRVAHTAQTCCDRLIPADTKFSVLSGQDSGSQGHYSGTSDVERFLFLWNILPWFLSIWMHFNESPWLFINS